MPYYKFKNLMKFAELVGIKTLGDLAAYKHKNNIKKTQELYLKLYTDALIIKKNVSLQNEIYFKVS